MNRLFRDLFEGKIVLITGHTGFIGSWLAIWLNELGATVIGYALPPHTNEDNFVITKLEEKIVSVMGDVRNYDKLSNIFKQYKPEIVFHLAAQPIVRKSYETPKETYDINVGGTINVFEIFRKNENCRVLINVSTDKCYENQEFVWGYRENDRLGGYDPYSSSKACSELVTSAYRQSFFNSISKKNKKFVSSVRSGNVIGGGDWQEDRLVPDCMRAIKNNEEIKIRNPQSIRPWQYVLEPIRGYLTLATNMWENDEFYSSSWNFGPNNYDMLSVEEIVKKIIQYMGKGNYNFLPISESDNLHETKTLLLDSSKSFRYLGWKTEINLDQTIKFVCDWYVNENINYEFDVCQIKEYLKKIK